MLAMARSKAQRAPASIWFGSNLQRRACRFRGRAFMPVVNSLFFHHQNLESKGPALAEIWRVLQPVGELHIADWGRPVNPLMRVALLSVQLLDGFKTTRDTLLGDCRNLSPKLVITAWKRRNAWVRPTAACNCIGKITIARRSPVA